MDCVEPRFVIFCVALPWFIVAHTLASILFVFGFGFPAPFFFYLDASVLFLGRWCWRRCWCWCCWLVSSPYLLLCLLDEVAFLGFRRLISPCFCSYLLSFPLFPLPPPLFLFFTFYLFSSLLFFSSLRRPSSSLFTATASIDDCLMR
ncbi:hypothetical protein BO70DRAFT_89299 [Aspergillus heteromorphus CBS 117.55]|uniref:Transmembrane protein n=1 Tax=Aspergillus heteromorphus CBS 117.55 TaxID=1448321 RepID=A0A317WXU8_9EURO|nr:uncharacterized protein BO70DRAFT_89299 [Aspergillus heteromorphus CBS 117.55]PWY91266.1 hypothetical protein BO70DRAFT_89299 [Aspergillus heteromorphus CBS 117.55]